MCTPEVSSKVSCLYPHGSSSHTCDERRSTLPDWDCAPLPMSMFLLQLGSCASAGDRVGAWTDGVRFLVAVHWSRLVGGRCPA